jgi:hypothetical protein
MNRWDTIRSLVVIAGLIVFLLIGMACENEKHERKHTACCTADTCEREGHHK